MKSIILTLLFLTVVFGAYALPLYEVIKNDVTVRNDSSVMSTSLGQLNEGDKVEIVAEKFEWCKIRLPETFSCYIVSSFIKSSDTANNKGEVTASKLNIRNLPSFESAIIGNLIKGQTVIILEKQGEWYKINGYPYAEGWVHKQFLRKSEQQKTETSSDSSQPYGEEKEKMQAETAPLVQYDQPSGQKQIDLSQLSTTQIVSLLNEPDMRKKKLIHDYLIQRGSKIITELEALIPNADSNTIYSVMFVLSKICEKDLVFIVYFLSKVDPFNPLSAGIYLDIVQNIVKPKEVKAYYNLARENKLSLQDIEKAKTSLYTAYSKRSKE